MRLPFTAGWELTMSAKRRLARCRKDVAEAGDEPLPCGLTVSSEADSEGT